MLRGAAGNSIVSDAHTELGKLLDVTSQAMDAEQMRLNRFPLQRYKLIVKYKMPFIRFISDMLLAGCGAIQYGATCLPVRVECFQP